MEHTVESAGGPKPPELRILVVEDDPSAAALARTVLGSHFGPGCSVEVAQRLEPALNLCQARAYDAVLLDLNLPDSSGLQTLLQFRAKAPGQTLIVLTAEEDEALGIRAVRAGAEEYLVKTDISPLSLGRRVRYVIERSRIRQQEHQSPQQNARLITFWPSKGGVGNSTLTLNVAALMAAAGRSVLTLELSAGYGSFAAQLRMAPQQHLGLVQPEALEDQRAVSAVTGCVVRTRHGFDSIFGPQLPEQYIERSAEQTRSLLALASRLSDFVLVDAAAPSARVALACSDFTVLVAERSSVGSAAAEAAGQFLRSAGGEKLAVGTAVVTRSGSIEAPSAAEVSRKSGYPLLAMIPLESDALDANRSGAPVALAKPNLPFAQAVSELTERLLSEPLRYIDF